MIHLCLDFIRKMKRLFAILLIGGMLFPSCETEFSVIAPWKDITVVYGLINPGDSVHYIKINKAFLGKVDANVMAQIRDSLEYDPANLEVKVIEMKNGVWEKEYELTAITDTSKPSGTFYAPEQTIYTFFAKDMDPDNEMALLINNISTNKEVTANSPIIDNATGFMVNHGTPDIAFIRNNGDFLDPIAEWNSAKDGKRYQFSMRFNYLERNLDTGAETNKYIEIAYPTTTSSDIDGGQAMTVVIRADEFFNKIKVVLLPVSPSNNVERCIGYLDFFLDIGTEDLNTYIEVNEPSSGIVQERPEFTNIKDSKGNGQVGIFTCRTRNQILSKPLDKGNLPNNTVLYLKTGDFAQYGFVDGTLFNCPN